MARQKKYSSNIEAKKYFKSPLFLIAAIMISLVPVVIVARILTDGLGIVLLLGLLFSVISTVFAWLVFAGKTEVKKVKKFCRIMSYTRFLSTLVTIGFIVIASVLIISLLISSAAGSAGLYDVTSTIENQIKPFFDDVPRENLDEYLASYSDMFTRVDVKLRAFFFGVNDIDDFKAFLERVYVAVSYIIIAIDGLLKVANNNLWVFTLIVTLIFGLVATAMCFVNSALKKTVRQLQILSVGINGFRKSNAVAVCVGGTALVLTGLVMVFLDPILAAAPILLGSVLYVFAMMFSDVQYEKDEEEKGFIAADEIAEAANITV